MPMQSVSIVIPCYRQGRYLGEAISSCLAQTYDAVQTVVVNDGSDDNTDEVARSFGDRIVYVSQPNSGLPAARNAGIRAATGDYLLFLDSDDRLHPAGVESLVRSADESRLVLGQFEFFADDPTIQLPEWLGYPKEPLMNDLADDAALLVGNIASPCAFLSPRRAVTEIGLFDTSPKHYGCEDWDLWTRLVLHGLEVHRIPTVVSYYRRHASSMTTSGNVRMDEAEVSLLQRNLLSLSGPGRRIAERSVGQVELGRRIRLKMRKELMNLAYAYRKRGDFSSAYSALVRSAQYAWPGRREVVEVLKTTAAALRKAISPKAASH
jgi:glycosyltransferase involved in cell wall biosynthesis